VPSGAAGVVLNVTVTNTTASSALTVWQQGSTQNSVSNLNWKAGETRANLVNVPLSASGQVSMFNFVGSTDVIADVEGYFAAPSGNAGGYNSLTPARLLDTRTGVGCTTLTTGSVCDLQVTGAGGVPAVGVSAVVLNATATNTSAGGFFTLYPSLTTKATVSNVNWAAGWTVPNRVIVGVGTNGKVSIFNGNGSADAVIDVSGYFTNSTATGKFFTPLNPVRALDTRTAGGTLGPNGNGFLQVTGNNTVPAGATAAFFNTTVTNTTASSALVVYPGGGTKPGSSDLNWVAGQTIPNSTVATLSASGGISFYNFVGSTDVVFDLSGYFGGGAGVTITASTTSIPADNKSTSKIDVTVFDASGNPVALDPVSITTTPTPAGACGTLSSNSGTTGSNGKIPTITYTASTTPGTCKITATELIKGQNASVTITQTPPQNTVVISPTSECDACSINVNGDGTSSFGFTVTVTNPVTAAVVVGDTVTVTNTANPSTPGACGTNGALSGTPAGTTNVSGQVLWTYTSSAAVGFCNVKATESATSGSDTVMVTQNVPGALFFNGISLIGTTTSTATGGACAGCNVQIFANGKDTVSLTTTVSGPSQNNDAVTYTFTFNSPSGSCGTIAPVNGTTNTSGVFKNTYTASTTVGECDITVTEANSGNETFFTIGQDVVPGNVALAASPQTIQAIITSTSTLTVTATSGIDGTPLVGDTITFAEAGNPGGACGPITGGPFKTNSSGQATATYTATTTVGFCHISADDTISGGSGLTRITQTNPVSAALVTTVTASPTSIPADNATPSAITATIKTSGGTPVGAGDIVEFVKSGSVSGVCSGTVSALTNGSGVATFNYTASTTVGTCTFTATEANSGSSGSATVTQTTVPNQVTVTPASTGVAVGPNTDNLTVNVMHLTTAVSADQITFSTSANPSGACGTIDTLVPATGKTDSSGNVTAVYHATATTGFCTITATESLGGQTGTTTIAQTNTTGNITTVTYLPFTNPVANGTDTRAVTATITGTGNHINDTVIFTTGSAAPAGACGTITVTSGNTGTGNTATATYKASTTAGACTITAREANGNSLGTVVITSNQKPNNITIGANPTIVSVSGGGTSAVSVNVTDGNTNAAVVGDHVTFVVSGAGCGTVTGVTPASGNTDSSGNVTATYNVGTGLGSCSVTATEGGTGASASVTITQIA
jgi:hypothetical protein